MSIFHTLLGELNLDEQEEKAYMVLAQFGKSTLEKISFLSGIPIKSTDGVMNKLIERNLIIKDEQRHVFCINNEKIPDTLLKIPRFDTASNVIPTFLTVNGEAQVEEYWKRVQDQTKDELLIFSGDISWVDRRFDDIKKMIDGGVSCKIIFFKFTKKITMNVKKAVEAGVEVSYFDDSMNTLRCIVSDEDKLYITEKIPKLGSFERLDEGFSWDKEKTTLIGTLVTGGVLPRSFRHYFYSIWKNSIPFSNYFQSHDINDVA